MTITVGERVAAWRKNADMDASELAKRIGVTRQAIAQIESGGDPRLKTLEAITATLGLSMAQFFGPLPSDKSS